MSDTEWLDALPSGSVVAAYDPEFQWQTGTLWSWRKEGAAWVHVGGAAHELDYVASKPNLTIVYRPWPRVGTITPDALAELDTHGKQAREAVEQ